MLRACQARGLIDFSRESNRLSGGVDPSLLAEERRIDLELSATVVRQYQPPNTPATMSSQLSMLIDQREAVRARIREASPNYAAIVQPQPLTALQIQKDVLDDKTVLLEYWLGEDESYLWVVTSQDVTTHRLPRRAEIEPRARLLTELLRERNRMVPGESPGEKRKRTNDADIKAMALTRRVGPALLGPLNGRFIGKRLCIVASDALQYVPFAALIEHRKSETLHIRTTSYRLPRQLRFRCFVW